MKRIVSVWFPMWPIERISRAGFPQVLHDDAAWALIESGHRGLIVTAANSTARRQGIRVGQVLADARAALPGLKTRPAEPERDRLALEKLAFWCGRYGPCRNIQAEPENNIHAEAGIWIDVTGVDHLFGGEAALLGDLITRLERMGITARAGLAETHGGAFALARFGCTKERRWAIAEARTVATALAPLPVEALRLDERTVLLLKRLGLRRIGQLYRLPREALARRFRTPATVDGRRRRAGLDESLRAAGEVVLRLDQALGLRVEMRRPLAEPPVRAVRQSYPDPLVSSDGIVAHSRVLVTSLCQALETSQEGVRRLRLTLYRTDGTSAEVGLGTSRPVRDPEHLMALLEDRLDTLDAGFGIDIMTLEAVEVEAGAGEQARLDGIATGLGDGLVEAIPGALIDRLSSRLGPDRVLRLAMVESHVPERTWRLAPALACAGETGTVARHDTGWRNLALDEAGCKRPPLLLARPERIEVLAAVPDGPPVQFSWRRVRRRVVQAEGPERIAPEWWRTIGRAPAGGNDRHMERTRDYYRLRDENGAGFWVFRAGLYSANAIEECNAASPAPSWFMHGLFP